jgi:hypothetical protein
MLCWIIPFMSEQHGRSLPDLSLLTTIPDQYTGIAGNVLQLFGALAERCPTFTNILLEPKIISCVFYPTFALIFLIVVSGAGILLYRKETRVIAAGLLLTGFLAWVFATGVTGNASPHDINAWLFIHIPLWRAFGDAGKWVAWLALVYSLLFGITLDQLSRLTYGYARYSLIIVAFILPILYTPTLFFGLDGRMSTITATQNQSMSALSDSPQCVITRP